MMWQRLFAAVALVPLLSGVAFGQAVDQKNPTFSKAGVVAGAPTGGNMGVGTINVQNGIYQNGTPVTGTGTVTNLSVATENGFAGNVSSPTTTPVINLLTTVQGILKGNQNGTLGAAVPGTDYLTPTGNGSGLSGMVWSQIGSTPTTLSGYGIGTTGTGSAVQATSPTLVTPNLGTPSAAVLTNATGLPVSTGISGLGSGVGTALGLTPNANGGMWLGGTDLQAQPVTIPSVGQMQLGQALGGACGVIPVCPVNGAINITGTSSATPGNSIFSIVNNTPAQSTNLDGYDIYSHDTTTMTAFGATAHPRYFRSDLSVATGVTATTIYQNLRSDVWLSGPGTMGVETNGMISYFQANAGAIDSSTVEGYESSALNYGTMNIYTDYLSKFWNESTATVTNVTAFNVNWQNDNTTAGSWSTMVGLACGPNIGSGATPTNYYCVQNKDPLATIATAGKLHVGSFGTVSVSAWLEVEGPDTSGGTFPIQVRNSAGNNMFLVSDAPGSAVSIYGTLGLGQAGSQVGTVSFANATSGNIKIAPPTGALGAAILTLPDTTGTIALTSSANCNLTAVSNLTVVNGIVTVCD